VTLRTTEDFLKLITSEHIEKPKYVQTVTVTIQPLADESRTLVNFPLLFDVDYAVGDQEDKTGQWIGKTRFVPLGNVFFSWDTPGLGWEQGNWRGPFDSPAALTRLDDYHYRILLYATIAANNWDGSVPGAYLAWDTLFANTGLQILIQDEGYMSMLYALRGTTIPDAVTQALFTSGQMNLKPVGVQILDYVFQSLEGLPFFGFDIENDTVSGWDVGVWGTLVPPGSSFLPVGGASPFITDESLTDDPSSVLV
jgi:hypothetical protein